LSDVVRTYAPRGPRLVLSAWRRWEHLSVIAARFLLHLLRQMPGLLLVIWDGASNHRSQPVKALLASEVGQRLCLEQLPAYAPDLNPAERV
jgi:transposase